MADTEKPSAPVAKVAPVDSKKASLIAKLDELDAHYKSFAGKPGHNPFFALARLQALREKVNVAVTDEVTKAVNEFQKAEPLTGTPAAK